MNSSLTAAMQARRHPDTTHIDRLATADSAGDAASG